MVGPFCSLHTYIQRGRQKQAYIPTLNPLGGDTRVSAFAVSIISSWLSIGIAPHLAIRAAHTDPGINADPVWAAVALAESSVRPTFHTRIGFLVLAWYLLWVLAKNKKASTCPKNGLGVKFFQDSPNKGKFGRRSRPKILAI